MNKNDIILSLVVLLISGLLFGIFNLTEKDSNKKAIVYYESKEVLTIDLSKTGHQEYTVDGYNGSITIEVDDNKIKVSDEISPLHLCSKQGYISRSYESIICLPNKVVIEIEDSDELDTIAR